jgi:hypothetical protein
VGGNKFVELEVQHQRIFVLGLLNQEYHQEGDNGGTSVDDELSSFGVVEDWPRQGPKQYRAQRRAKSQRRARPNRDLGGKPCE